MPVERAVDVRRFCVNATMVVLLVCAGTSTNAWGQTPSLHTGQVARQLANSVPVFFVENRGVEIASTRYYVRHRSGAVLFLDDRVVLRQASSPDHEITMRFPGSRADLRVEPREPLDTRVHYFQGKEPDWKTDVPTFGAVIYREVWPGIDLVFRGTRGKVKYEFRLSAGADLDLIRVAYEGSDALRIEADGSLAIRAGGTTTRDDAPVAWQMIDGDKCDVAVRFVIENGDTLGFCVGEYDKSTELVIDPSVLVYCGYAGTSMAAACGIAVGSSGEAIIAGATYNGFPPDSSDVCLIKVSPDGSRLLWTAYLRGSGAENAMAVAVDSNGSIYCAGTTDSDERSFPVKVGPDLTYNQGTDGFVCKLSSDGSKIEFCGYVGGSSIDSFRTAAVDVAGCLWAGGYTFSANFPTNGNLGTRYYKGDYDGAVCKVSADGKNLLVSGYFSGAFSEIINGIAIDANNDVYITGATDSDQATFPVKVGPRLTYNSPVAGMSLDGFVAKLQGATGSIEYSGYIGGTSFDEALGIAVDGAGNAYVTGRTASDESSFPTIVGPFLTASNGLKSSLNHDGFLTKIDPSGQNLVYSGFLPYCGCFGVQVDAAQGAYLVGAAYPLFATTGGSMSTYAGGGCDGCVMKVPASGKGVLFASLFGGAYGDTPLSLAIDASGNMYTCGFSDSPDFTFPVKVGPSLVYNGTWGPFKRDATFVAKLAEVTLLGSGSSQIGGTINWALTTSSAAGRPYAVGTSLGQGPIPIDQRTLGLSIDGLLRASVGGSLPGVFASYSGQIDGTGKAVAALHIPNLKILIGYRLYAAFITLDPTAPSGIGSISNTEMITVQ